MPFLFYMLLFSACNSTTTSPEEVVRAYQAYLDQNDFQSAMALSTPEEARRLADVETLMKKFPTDTTRLESSFLSIDCQRAGVFIDCICEIEDQEVRYDMTFRLKQLEDTWKVDLPLD